MKEKNVLQERCPKCSSSVVWKTGKNGAFLSCSDFPTCKGKIDITDTLPNQKALRDGKRLDKETLKLYHSVKRKVWRHFKMKNPSNVQMSSILQRHYKKSIDTLSEVKLATIWYAEVLDAM